MQTHIYYKKKKYIYTYIEKKMLPGCIYEVSQKWLVVMPLKKNSKVVESYWEGDCHAKGCLWVEGLSVMEATSNQKLVFATSIAFSSAAGGRYTAVDITKEINNSTQVSALKHVCWLKGI